MTDNITKLPAFYDMPYTQDGGRMTPDSHFYNDQLWQTLNEMVNQFNNGIVFPSYTTAQIVALEPNSSVGAVWFNTTLAKLQVKTATGVIETIQSV